jgi:hypothetical protein
MNTQLKAIGGVLISVFLVTASFGNILPEIKQARATTVKKKDGQTLEGEIKGVIVQKGSLDKYEGASTKAYFSYNVIQGRDITLIDEHGIHLAEGSKFLYVLVDGATPPNNQEDIEALYLANHEKEIISLSSGGSTNIVFTLPDSKRKMVPTYLPATELGASDKLVGELRLEKKWKGKIIPAIEIVTKDGMATIPVTEIIDFKK